MATIVYKVYESKEAYWKENGNDNRLVGGEKLLVQVKGVTLIDYTVPAGKVLELKTDIYGKETNV